MSLTPTATAADPTPPKSPSMHSRIVCKDPGTILDSHILDTKIYVRPWLGAYYNGPNSNVNLKVVQGDFQKKKMEQYLCSHLLENCFKTDF